MSSHIRGAECFCDDCNRRHRFDRLIETLADGLTKIASVKSSDQEARCEAANYLRSAAHIIDGPFRSTAGSGLVVIPGGRAS